MSLQQRISDVFETVRPWLDTVKFNDNSRIASLNARLAALVAAAGTGGAANDNRPDDAPPSLAIRTTDVARLIDEVIRREGGYVNHPHDKGGETNWGITVAIARANGFGGPMRDLPRATAAEIYRREYWLQPGFDKVAAIYPRVGAELFDTGINMGQKTAAEFLQRVMNALDPRDIDVDGRIGTQTLDALAAFRRQRGAAGEKVLVAALDCLQGERYIRLVERRAQNRSFLFGWIAHRIGQA